MTDQVAKQNTDRELWRERPDDYYAASLHVTEGGGIGMNVGGHVIVKPIRDWHALVSWKCKAQPTADPPQDCDWPHCGCDPHAQEVIECLIESGWAGPDEAFKLREALRFVLAWLDHKPTPKDRIYPHGTWEVRAACEAVLGVAEVKA
jgi:hypothetical protein